MDHTKNYRICFDYAADSPRQAVSHLLGIIADPELQDKPFDWLVIDQDSGEEFKIRCTLDEIESEARECLRKLIDPPLSS
jgi:hypothetical protein